MTVLGAARLTRFVHAGIVESIGQRAQQQPFHAMHRRRLLGRNAKALGIEVDRANHRATKHALETDNAAPTAAASS